MPETISEGWHLDKRVPLAIIIAIFVQTAGAIWWAASVSSRVATLEQAIAARSDQSSRIVRLETQLQSVERGVVRIESKLDRLIEAR